MIVGLSIIAFAYLAMFASLAVRGTPRLVLGLIAFVLGSVAALAFLGLVALERDEPFACPAAPGRDSETAPDHWSWIPPGNVCEYATGDVGPTYWRIPAGLAIVALPVCGPRRGPCAAAPKSKL